MKRKCYNLLLPVFLLLLATGAKAQLISTIAGTGVAGNLSGGGPATSAQFEGPNGIAVDQYGNVFIADSGNNIIRMVSTTGIITTVAGGGSIGGLGDGYSALLGTLNSPTGVAVDTSGNIYIADFGNNRIRKVIKTSGVIITIAGGGLSGAEGVPAVTAQLNGPYGVRVNQAGDVYIADRNDNVVRKVTSGIINTVAGNWLAGLTLDGGPATNAELNLPAGVAIDALGDIYFADQANNVVRMVDFGTHSISTIAGNNMLLPGYTGDGGQATAARLNQPCGVAVDGSLNVYISDYGNNVVRMVKHSSGVISTVVGNAANLGASGSTGDGGPATAVAVKLFQPCGIWYNSGNLYIADQGNNKVRKAVVTPAIGNITTIAGNGSPGYTGDGGLGSSATLTGPTGVSMDPATGNLYIADAGNNVIRKLAGGLLITTVAGTGIPGYTGDALAATDATLKNPTSVVFDVTSGNIYIADQGNNSIREVFLSGSGAINTVASDGTGAAGYYGEGTAAVLAHFDHPYGIATDVNGDFYIGDTKNDRIREVFEDPGDPTTFQKVFTVAGNLYSVGGYGGLASYVSLRLPSGVCMSSSGIVYIADQGNNVVRMIDAIGVIHTIAGTGVAGYSGDGVLGGATAAKLNAPYAVAYDDSLGYLYIADAYNNVIRKLVTGTGTISTFAGNTTGGYTADNVLATSTDIFGPTGVDLDKYHNLYIADKFNSRVRKVNFLTNVITTIAGTGKYGFLADGGSALLSDLNAPYGTAYDSLNKSLYIADRNNNVIRMVDKLGNISTYAGTGLPGFSGDGGLATLAQLDGPISIALDKNLNLYISDQGNNVIREVNYLTKNISTIAGMTGLLGVGDVDGSALSSMFYYPTGICVNPAGTALYIADGNNNKVKKLTPISGAGTVSTVAGSGIADSLGDGFSPTSARLNDPIGVTLDPALNLYIADFSNNTVRKVNAAGTIITRYAGDDTMGYFGDNGPAIYAHLRMPTAVTSDASGNIFISDMGNYRVRIVSTAGIIKSIAGNGTQGYSGDGGAAPLAQINNAFGISVDTTGNYYIADRDNNVIRKVTTVLIAEFKTSVSAVCQDSCITFANATIGNTDSIRWTTNAPSAVMSAATGDTNTICFNAAGSYTVTLTAWYHGKSSVADTPINISATPFPVIIPGGGGNVTLSGAYSTYQWLRNGTPIVGATTASYTSVVTGTFTVTVDSNGCIGTSAALYVNPGALGLTTPYVANNFWLSHQDNNTAILHSAQQLDNDLAIEIYDATGRDILDDSWKQGSNSLQVNGASLPPGLYIIKMSNKNTSAVLKWLKD